MRKECRFFYEYFYSYGRRLLAGDCICATRFLPAVFDRFPDAKIDVYLDTCGNPMQKKWLETFFPQYFNSIITIPSKKYSKCFINSQFGEESGVGVFENIPDEYQAMMLSPKYNYFIDLWIDGLQWTKNREFNFLKYFYHFPSPKIQEFNIDLPERFALLHLVPNNYKTHGTFNDPWYNKQLIKKLSKNVTCLIISTPEVKDVTDEFADMENTHIISGPIEEIAYILSKASILIALDSGIAHLSKGLGVPKIIYAPWTTQPETAPPSHKLRWFSNPTEAIPLNYNMNYVDDLAKRILDNPFISVVRDVKDFDRETIFRKYQVNEEKSILA